MKKGTFWSQYEVGYIQAHWRDMTDAEMGEELERTVKGVCNQRLKMHLIRDRNVSGRWSEKDDEFIELNAHKLTDEEIGAAINRTAASVMMRRHTLNVIRDPVNRASIWGQGPVIRSAKEFIDSLGDAPNYERIPLVHQRIQEVRACLLQLFINGPERTWVDSDARSLVKLRRIIVDLKAEMAKMYAEGSRINEAA